MLSRIVALAFCVTAISSACVGGGASEEAQTTDGSGVTQASDGSPAYTATCITGMTSFVAGGPSPADAAKVVEGFCREAAARGLLSDKDATWSELAPVLQDNLDLLDPLCVSWGRQAFEELPASARADVEITSAEWGRQLCRAFFDDDYVGPNGTMSDSQLTGFVDDHPDLVSPFLVASLMAGYDQARWVGISRATFKRLAERTVAKALAGGAVTFRTMTDYDVDRERFREIFLDALQDYSKE